MIRTHMSLIIYQSLQTKDPVFQTTFFGEQQSPGNLVVYLLSHRYRTVPGQTATLLPIALFVLKTPLKTKTRSSTNEPKSARTNLASCGNVDSAVSIQNRVNNAI
uniref:Uncharacterized protein n=1 Tax=Ciona intestinalis TaxID=7719 RepID=F6YC90_CIOIN